MAHTKIGLLRMIVVQKNNLSFMKDFNERFEKGEIPEYTAHSKRNHRFYNWDLKKCEGIIDKCVDLIKTGRYKEVEKEEFKFGSYIKGDYKYYFSYVPFFGRMTKQKIIKKIKISKPSGIKSVI